MTLPRPDDWHVHLRDGDMLRMALPWTRAARAIVMPNLDPPVTTASQAVAYRDRIRRVLPGGSRLEPLMTCFLTDETNLADVAQGFTEGVFTAVKLYPARSTTNTAAGVTDIRHVYRVLERMQATGMPLLIHGEVADSEVVVFDRVKAFIDKVLVRSRSDFPALRVVLEHITTAEAVDYVQDAEVPSAPPLRGPPHDQPQRDVRGRYPAVHVLPARSQARGAPPGIEGAATSGDPRFLLGTDSAPHLIQDKESACGCAGIFTAPLRDKDRVRVFRPDGVVRWRFLAPLD